MKKIILSAMLMALSAVGFGININVHNTSTFCGETCVYEVKLTSISFHKAGYPDYSVTERFYHTITPGNTYTWSVSAPAGYTIDWSTLSMLVKYCTTPVTVGNVTSYSNYNPCSCSLGNYVTLWNWNSDGDYNVYCDMILGKSLEGAESPEQLKGDNHHQEKKEGVKAAVEEKSSSVSPNPSTGLFTLDPGLPGAIYNVTVTDATGKVVYSKNDLPGASPLQIDLSALPRGIYLLNLVSGDKRISHKLVKD